MSHVPARVLRSMRRWLSGRLRFRFRGGRIVDWSGELAADAAVVIDGLQAFYGEQYPDLAKADGAKIDKAAAALFDVYRVNVFPGMNIQWGAYPSLLEHEAGCFRCHNNEHKSPQDKAIGKKCTTCHEVLAEQEDEPEVLGVLYP